MVKHTEDQGDVYLTIADDGSIVYVCQACHKTWVGEATPLSTLSQLDRKQVVAQLEGFKPAAHFDFDIAAIH